MSRPFGPAAWALPSPSPRPAAGSGCSSITISFSRMVAARTRRSYPQPVRCPGACRAGARTELLQQHGVLVRVRGRARTQQAQRHRSHVEDLVARRGRDQGTVSLLEGALLAVDDQATGARADEIELLGDAVQ